MEQKDREE